MNFLKGFKDGFSSFGHNISNLVNAILLSIVYFLGVGFTKLLSLIFKKSFLDLKLSSKDSYWNDLDLSKKKLEDYYRQF